MSNDVISQIKIGGIVYDIKDSSVAEQIQNSVSQKTNVQIVTWDADD